MPKRTNDFQSLVALIERSLAPQGAVVTESALVGTGAKGDLREIDVLIESTVGPYKMKIAVESKDEGRKMDIVKFESIVGKYLGQSGIKVNQVVVVSRKGFFKPVHARAARENIALLTLSKAMKADWAEALDQQLSFAILPHLAGFEFRPMPEGTTAAELATARIICACCGRDHGSAAEFASYILRNRAFVREIRTRASRSPGMICVRPNWTLAPMLRLRVGSRDFFAEQIIAHIHCAQARGPLSVSAYRRGDQLVHHLSGDVGGKRVEFVLPHVQNPHQIALRISDAEVLAETTKVAKSPLEMSVTDPLIPDELAAVPSLIKASIAGLDVQLEENAILHDFSTGTDIRFAAVMTLYTGGAEATRTALALIGANESLSAERLAKLSAISLGTEIDRLLVVTDAELSGDAELALREYKTLAVARFSQVRSTEIVQRLFPPIVLWMNSLRAFDAFLFSAVTHKPVSLTMQSRLEIGPHRSYPLEQFYDAFAGRIRTFSVAAFLRGKPSSQYADVAETFDCCFPRGAQLVPDTGPSIPVAALRGTATVRAIFAILDIAAVVQDGTSGALRFHSSVDGFPSVTTASLPRNANLRVDCFPTSGPTNTASLTAPQAVFAPLVGSLDAEGLAESSRAGTKLAHLQMTGDPTPYFIAGAGLKDVRFLAM